MPLLISTGVLFSSLSAFGDLLSRAFGRECVQMFAQISRARRRTQAGTFYTSRKRGFLKKKKNTTLAWFFQTNSSARISFAASLKYYCQRRVNKEFVASREGNKLISPTNPEKSLILNQIYFMKLYKKCVCVSKIFQDYSFNFNFDIEFAPRI